MEAVNIGLDEAYTANARNIHDKLGTTDLCIQLAEECAELGQACMKMARHLRKDNHPAADLGEIWDSLVEETADVKVAMDAMWLDALDVYNVQKAKAERWAKRLGLEVK